MHVSLSAQRETFFTSHLNMLDFGYFIIVTVFLNEKNNAKILKS